LGGLCLAVVAVGIAALIAIPGCLNPRPEELPSSQNTSVTDPGLPGPVRETCADNPYLGGCSLPDDSVNSPAGSAPESSPMPGAPGFGAVGDAGDGTEADAGAGSDPEADSSSDAGP
jgi:hypothetical protein